MRDAVAIIHFPIRVPAAVALLICCWFTAPAADANEPPADPSFQDVLAVEFSQTPIGPYEQQQARDQWPGLQWFALRERGEIVSDGAYRDRSLRVGYPAGSVGPSEGGGQFRVRLPARDEYYLSYMLKFEEGFDFRRGGKLPGLCGGRANTGGNRPTGDGWSARYMWRGDGRIVVYLYHLDQRGRYGDYQLTQRIRVNTPGEPDGHLQVWVDGREALHRQDIRYRSVPGAQVDTFYFSTFHGGNTPDWAPRTDSFALFDQFRIGIR